MLNNQKKPTAAETSERIKNHMANIQKLRAEAKARCEYEIIVEKYFGYKMKDKPSTIVTDDHILVDLVCESYQHFTEQSASDQNKELQELREWKASAMANMPDMQSIGKLIGVPLGESVHDKIVPYLKQVGLVSVNAISKQIDELEDRKHEVLLNYVDAATEHEKEVLAATNMELGININFLKFLLPPKKNVHE